MGQTSWAQLEAMGSPCFLPSKPGVDWRMCYVRTGCSGCHRLPLQILLLSQLPSRVQAQVAQQCDPGPGGLGTRKLPVDGWDEASCPRRVGSSGHEASFLHTGSFLVLGEKNLAASSSRTPGTTREALGTSSWPQGHIKQGIAQVMGRGLRGRVPAWLLAAGQAGGLSGPTGLHTCERWASTALQPRWPSQGSSLRGSPMQWSLVGFRAPPAA